jgi:NAD(P)-dependent dehydrogenase (short-subunit alcohol dehydrogenase family)
MTEFGRVDIVVANAGVTGPTSSISDVSYDDWRACMATNLDGVFLVFRAFARLLLRQDQGGSLIAIGSVTGKQPLAGRTPYAASKAALVGLVRSAAWDLGSHRIRVNLVSPGPVAGERFEGVLARQAASDGVEIDEVRRQFANATPLRRTVSADEVAQACLFLASDAASAITGQDLNVAAGYVMH